jgi:hypothetical protein
MVLALLWYMVWVIQTTLCHVSLHLVVRVAYVVLDQWSSIK